MFRVKLQAPLQLLKNIEDQVKAGLRGMGYVKIDSAAEWPPKLAVKLPPNEQAGK
jgi:HlyD family secretion protein